MCLIFSTTHVVYCSLPCLRCAVQIYYVYGMHDMFFSITLSTMWIMLLNVISLPCVRCPLLAVKHCNFHEKDREVKPQIIQRCAMSKVRDKGLSEPTITLQRLLTS